MHPLPKKKYGNDMAKHGPYMTHIWEWYGKVGWRYGTDMRLNFAMFSCMENVWEEKLTLSIVWESYGITSSIYIP